MHYCSSVCTRNIGCCCSLKQRDLEVLPAFACFCTSFLSFLWLPPQSCVSRQMCTHIHASTGVYISFLFGSFSFQHFVSHISSTNLHSTLSVNTLFRSILNNILSPQIHSETTGKIRTELSCLFHHLWIERSLHPCQWIQFSSLGCSECTGLDLLPEADVEGRQEKERQINC